HGIIIRPESGYGPEVTGKNREPVAAWAYGNGLIIPLHVPLAPPGIAKAKVRSHPPIRMAEGARMKSIRCQRSGFRITLIATVLLSRAINANRILAVDCILLLADERTRI